MLLFSHVEFTVQNVAMIITCNYLLFISCSYKRILVIISHSQDFLNGVCTNIIHMHKEKLVYYGVRIIIIIINVYI